jgi:hypothetical protein
MSESEVVELVQEKVNNSVIEIDGSNAGGDVEIEATAPKIDLEDLKTQGIEALQQIIEWAQSPKFYAQVGIIVAAIIVALLASKIVDRYLKAPSQPPQVGSMGKLRESLFKLKRILFPLLLLLLLGAGVEVVNSLVQQSWLVRIVQGLAVVGLMYSIISQFVESESVKKFVK